MEIRIANHKPADTLKETQLLFNAFELMLEFPNDPNTYSLDDEVMFGSDLLIAPVLWPEPIPPT